MTIQYQFNFTPYRYSFNQPLRTSHGIWRVREGLIITLRDPRLRSSTRRGSGSPEARLRRPLRDRDRNIGKGEIAPIPWFGSETLEDALNFCSQLGNTVTEEDIVHIPDSLPACQFAFESAIQGMRNKERGISNEGDGATGRRGDGEELLRYCYLLPAGNRVLDCDLEKIIKSSKTLLIDTFKWKIGVYPLAEEIAILQQLISRLPTQIKLRLDANGGLTLSEAHQLLKVTDKMPQVEFIEQPLAPSKFTEMMVLTARYQTSLALDESVTNISQLQDCYQKGWRGVFVIKSAIAGRPSLLRQFCQQHSLDLVFSSVFETSIGRQAALKLAAELGNKQRAVGFGTDYYFKL